MRTLYRPFFFTYSTSLLNSFLVAALLTAGWFLYTPKTWKAQSI